MTDGIEAVPRRRLTLEQIEAGRSPAGGWTKATLAAWGVPWPPPKGWLQRLTGNSGTTQARPADSLVMGRTGAGNVIPPDEDWPPWEPGPAGNRFSSLPDHSDHDEGKAMTMTLFDEIPADTDPRPRGWKRTEAKTATGSPSLTPAEAARMYRSGMSACEIAHAYAITRQGAESKIREGGLGGVQWCPICRTHEELQASL